MNPMPYILENSAEARRLEIQARMANYDLGKEMASLAIASGSRVLDAGCGSGLVSRNLIDRFPGIRVTACDFSNQRVQQARKLADREPYRAIEFRQADLLNLPFGEGEFDWVVCRFVLEHLETPQRAADGFFRTLKKGGKICLIDLDGIIFNIHTRDVELRSLLETFRSKWKSDLFVGRKLPAILKDAGFDAIRWEMQPMQFHGHDLADELELTRQRLEFSLPALEPIFGGEKPTRRFVDLYLAEMQKPEVTLFYNKFVVYAQKP